MRRALAAAACVIALAAMSSDSRLTASAAQASPAQAIATDISPEALAQIDALISG